MTDNLQAKYQELYSRAEKFGQQHIFRFWDELNEQQKANLLEQVSKLNFEKLNELVEKCVLNHQPFKLPDNIEPADFFPAEPKNKQQEEEYKQAWETGEQALKRGKVCAFTVAGGAGTRLGFDGPKGTFPISPIKNKTLFQIFAETIKHCQNRYNPNIRWYIMTSVANHKQTIDFFEQNNYFELPKHQVKFFEQGTMPAFSKDGKLLLAEKDSLALSPDGHGGSLRAMKKSGALKEMRELGIEYISYFQVDNPLVKCLDPLFIGLHILHKSEMSSKSLAKNDDLEKVGNFVIGDGKLMVIEYSDLPDELAHAKNPDGSRKFNAGSIAIHILSRNFIERITEGELQLPYHRAIKKVTFIDDNGRKIKPEEPNAIKLEQFVFDAIPLAKNAIVLQTKREEEFSPVKNADGNDSPATCKRDMIARAKRWMEQADIYSDDKAIVEISPLRAIFADDLKLRMS